MTSRFCADGCVPTDEPFRRCFPGAEASGFAAGRFVPLTLVGVLRAVRGVGCAAATTAGLAGLLFCPQKAARPRCEPLAFEPEDGGWADLTFFIEIAVKFATSIIACLELAQVTVARLQCDSDSATANLARLSCCNVMLAGCRSRAVLSPACAARTVMIEVTLTVAVQQLST